MNKDMIKLTGEYNSWYSPKFLYHGTCTAFKRNIVQNGIRPDIKKKNSPLSSDGVYLTSSLFMAYQIAQRVAKKNNSNPLIIKIPVIHLNPDYLQFDFNICLYECSCSMLYIQKIQRFYFLKEENYKNIPEELFMLNTPDEIERAVWDLNNDRIPEKMKNL